LPRELTNNPARYAWARSSRCHMPRSWSREVVLIRSRSLCTDSGLR